MTTYSDAVTRTGTLGTDTDPLVPEPLVAELIREATKRSAVMSQIRTVRMASGTSRQPVLATKPVAFWGDGDTGLAQTTSVDWKGISLVAEPLTVIVPIPKSYLADTIIDVWSVVRDELAEALALKVDAACIFGVDAPGTFGKSIYDSADEAGNVVASGTGADLGVDLAALGKLIKRQGYAVNGFFAEPGYDFDLYGIRSQEGTPIYQSLQDAPGGRIMGRQATEVDNGAWDATKAVYIAGDWSKAQFGIRQDVTWEVSDSAVISDGSGNVVQNLWQSNMTALKVYARYAWAVAKPVTALQDSETLRSPFGILAPAVSA